MKTLLSLLLILLPTTALADTVYKCTLPDGKPQYTNKAKAGCVVLFTYNSPAQAQPTSQAPRSPSDRTIYKCPRDGRWIYEAESTPGCVALPNSRSPKSDLSFGGYPCTVDCSGHEAGYDWAEENDITDADDCGGKSLSFIEGCEEYVEEHQEEESDSEDEDGIDSDDSSSSEGDDSDD